MLKKDIRYDYPRNLMAAIMKQDYYNDRLPDIEDVTNTLLTLLPHEKDVIEFRYKDGLTLKETGEYVGVTGERIRQIELKALRKLRHKSRLNNLVYVQVKASDYNALLNEVRKLRADVSRLMIEMDTDPDFIIKKNKQVSIDELNLSIRPYNCLKRAGINTIGDILTHDLLRVRNLGRKSLHEIVNVVESYGFSDEMSKYK